MTDHTAFEGASRAMQSFLSEQKKLRATPPDVVNMPISYLLGLGSWKLAENDHVRFCASAP